MPSIRSMFFLTISAFHHHSFRPITHTLRLYTGVVNEFGKELPVVIRFDEILEVCTSSSGS